LKEVVVLKEKTEPTTKEEKKEEVVPSYCNVEREDSAFATVSLEEGLVDEEGNQIEGEGKRVKMIYPMRSDSMSGIVWMRMMSCKEDTGCITTKWVKVYDPDSDKHYLSNFSFFP
jgi:hypothetical protein